MSSPARPARSVRRPCTATLARGVAAGLLGLLLTGCGTDDVISAATGADVEIDRDGESVRVTTDEGSVATSVGGELPDGFPASVDLVEGEIVSGMQSDTPDGEGWMVLVQTDGAAQPVLDDAVARLEAGGFSRPEGAVSAPGVLAAQLSDGAWGVMVTVLDSGDEGVVAQYLVVDASAMQ